MWVGCLKLCAMFVLLVFMLDWRGSCLLVVCSLCVVLFLVTDVGFVGVALLG